MSENDNNNGKEEVEKKEEEKKEEEKKEEEKKEEDKNDEDKNEIEIEEPLGDKISILHYLKTRELYEDIESPRSLKAMNELGLIMDDIIFKSYEEYIENNPNLIPLSKEIKMKRYEFAEE